MHAVYCHNGMGYAWVYEDETLHNNDFSHNKIVYFTESEFQRVRWLVYAFIVHTKISLLGEAREFF